MKGFFKFILIIIIVKLLKLRIKLFYTISEYILFTCQFFNILHLLNNVTKI